MLVRFGLLHFLKPMSHAGVPIREFETPIACLLQFHFLTGRDIL